MPGAQNGDDDRRHGMLDDGNRPALRFHRFVGLPKRWIVERSFAWISRNRRLTRDFERYARTVATLMRLAMIRLMLKRLTKPSLCS
jgi:transposase